MLRQLNLQHTKYPSLVVDIQSRAVQDGRIRITGTAICAENQAAYPDIARYETKPVSPKRINSAIREAITEIEARYRDIYLKPTLTGADIRTAFASVADKVANGMHLRPTWRGASTNKQVILFFQRNTLELVIPYLLSDRMLLDEDRQALLEKMTQICFDNGSTSLEAARENAVKRLEQADLILLHMRDCDVLIPELSFAPAGFGEHAYRPEKVKMLPITVLLAFYAALRRLIRQYPKEVFFAVLAIYGFRPAEAAGVKPSGIMWFSNFCVVPVQFQEVRGKLSSHLKNNYSTRLVTVSLWGMRILKECCSLIGDDYPKDDTAMNSSPACAEWVKARLIEAGASEALLADIANDIPAEDMDDSSIDRKDPDKAGADRDAKVGCYVLRRCFATIGRVYMGFSLFEIDRLLGHIPHGSGKDNARKLINPDMNSPETQAKIAAKMERFVFDPELSLNPAIIPYTTKGRDEIPIHVPYAAFKMENNEDSEIELEVDLTCCEPGEALTLLFEKDTARDLHVSSAPVSFEDVSRTVFCDVLKDDSYGIMGGKAK